MSKKMQNPRTVTPDLVADGFSLQISRNEGGSRRDLKKSEAKKADPSRQENTEDSAARADPVAATSAPPTVTQQTEVAEIVVIPTGSPVSTSSGVSGGEEQETVLSHFDHLATIQGTSTSLPRATTARGIFEALAPTPSANNI